MFKSIYLPTPVYWAMPNVCAVIGLTAILHSNPLSIFLGVVLVLYAIFVRLARCK